MGRLAVAIVPLTHLLLPLWFVSLLWASRAEDPARWAAALFLAAGSIAFLWLAGAWSWFGRGPRFVLVASLAIGAWRTHPTGMAWSAVALPTDLELGLTVLIGALFFALSASALLGRRAPSGALALAFPLRGGLFLVGQGGSTGTVNRHAADRSQRWALDLLALNAWGVRARGLYPHALEGYAIFGCEVVSPCDGIVAAAVDGLPDLVPPARDPVHRAGNHVAIEFGDATIYLAHLQQGSVCVRPGERVRAGQRIGRVGNSGNTTEPHLHLHAERGRYPGRFSGGPGIPVRLDGRFLVRNDRIDAR